MDDLSIKFDTHEWNDLLKSLPQALAGKAVSASLAAGGAVLADAMEVEAPERTDDPTPGSNSLPPGILKHDVSFQVQMSSGHMPRVKVGCTEVAGRVAGWIENGFDVVVHGKKSAKEKRTGTVSAKHTPKTGAKHVDANPFMARAFESAIEDATNATLDSLQQSLTKAIAERDGSSG